MRIDVGAYEIDDDRLRVDMAVVTGFLATSYWARGRSPERIETACRNSLCLGAYERATMVGFTRVVSDHAVIAYLCDVFVVDAHRGRGLGKALVRAALDHPSLSEVGRFLLVTRDAHALYRPFGFGAPDDTGKYMVLDRQISQSPAAWARAVQPE